MKDVIKGVVMIPIKLAVSSVIGIGLLTEAIRRKYENKK